MSRHSDEATVLDIVAAARRILAFVADMDEPAFRMDLKTQAAVQHQILIVGEATKRLSESFRVLHPEIPWSDVARMRDRLIHGYDTVDLSIVWNTTREAVPRLLEAIESEIGDDRGRAPCPKQDDVAKDQ